MGQGVHEQTESSSGADLGRLLNATKLAGNCSHPIRLRGEAVNLATGEVVASKLSVACKDRRAAVCPACSYLYKADAWILVAAGLLGGKGVDASVRQQPRLFVTLTAPSFGAVHHLSSQRRCHVYSRGRCAHGHSLLCRQRHEDGSGALGTPLCVDCFDYEGAVLWNAYSSKLWNRTIQEIRRQLATNLSQEPGASHVSYLKVAEFQKRGLVHFHAILRFDDASTDEVSSSSLSDDAAKAMSVMRVLSTIHWSSPIGHDVRWGTQCDVRILAAGDSDGSKVASYVAKYATKGTDDSLGLARRFHSRDAIAHSRIEPHRQRLALTAWELGARPELCHLNLRAHAHALGFTGQIITKSRVFSTTFGELRAARALHMARSNATDPIEAPFTTPGAATTTHERPSSPKYCTPERCNCEKR